MRITATVNIDALGLKVRYLRDAARAGLKLGVSEAAGLIEAEAKVQVPVLTGRLRDSIHTETVTDEATKQEVVVTPAYESSNEYGFDPAYARRIEFGFVGPDRLGRVYNQPAQPYMRPAYDSKQDAAREAIKDSVIEQMDAAMAGVAGRR